MFSESQFQPSHPRGRVARVVKEHPCTLHSSARTQRLQLFNRLIRRIVHGRPDSVPFALGRSARFFKSKDC